MDAFAQIRLHERELWNGDRCGLNRIEDSGTFGVDRFVMDHIHPAEGALVVFLEPPENAFFVEPMFAALGQICFLVISVLHQVGYRITNPIGFKANAAGVSRANGGLWFGGSLFQIDLLGGICPILVYPFGIFFCCFGCPLFQIDPFGGIRVGTFWSSALLHPFGIFF